MKDVKEKEQMENMRITVCVEVDGEVISSEVIDNEESFMADVRYAYRNGNSVFEALRTLIDIGSSHLYKDEHCIKRSIYFEKGL